MRRIRDRLKIWNKWRKYNRNGWFYHILVLLGLRNSPTFMAYFLMEGLERGINEIPPLHISRHLENKLYHGLTDAEFQMQFYHTVLGGDPSFDNDILKE